MLAKTVKLFCGLATVLVCLTAITGSVRPSQLEQIRMQGTITVVTRNSPTTYFEDRTGATGYEFELAQAYADYLGVNLKVEVASSLDEIFDLLDTGKADFAAAGLTLTPERQRWYRFSEPYQYIREQVVYRRTTSKPRDLNDLPGKMLVVISNSSHSETLRAAQADALPELSWSETPDLDTTDLLQMVEDGEINFTVVDSNTFDTIQAYFPNVAPGFDLKTDQPLAWAFPVQRDNSIHQSADQFFATRKARNLLATLNERYYGHLDELDYVGAKRFLRQTTRKLERYREFFVTAAHSAGFDWRLLAAVGYQESHWDPLATSPTGVRGLMMLTMATAEYLGVPDRLDPEQSILGGGRYLAELRERLGDQVAEPDRTWLALAAYNIGYGHLQDARKMAYEMGGNPNLWRDVKETLPLLSQRRYFGNTKHGYARGWEAVDYVQNIRRYYDVLVWNEEQQLQQVAVNKTGSGNLHVSSAHVTVVPPLL